MDKPRFMHDCSSCVFLGQWEEYDLYFCPHDMGGPTIIGRYGDEGGDYTSGLGFRDHSPPLKEAFNRACDKGLLKREDYSPMVRCDCGVIRDSSDPDECIICKLKEKEREHQNTGA